jgi:hypothetical protein
MTPDEFAFLWLVRICVAAFVLWCVVSMYRHVRRVNRRVGLRAPFPDPRDWQRQFREGHRP